MALVRPQARAPRHHHQGQRGQRESGEPVLDLHAVQRAEAHASGWCSSFVARLSTVRAAPAARSAERGRAEQYWFRWRHPRLGRPSPSWRHTCSRRDRSSQVPTQLAVVPFPPARQRTFSRSVRMGHELHPCGLCPDSADHGDHFTPGLALISPRRSGCHPAQKRNHKQSRRRAAAAGSSQTGVPPSRGRLSAQPRGSVVNQRCHLPA
jgi:hypothetical protein